MHMISKIVCPLDVMGPLLLFHIRSANSHVAKSQPAPFWILTLNSRIQQKFQTFAFGNSLQIFTASLMKVSFQYHPVKHH